MMVVSKFTYTLETIIQAGKLLVAIDHVPIRTNPKTRESRLFPSMGAYVRRNAVSIFRIYAQYEPLRVFWSLALLIGLASIGVWIRFAVAYAEGNGKGHVQSLILGAVLFIAAVVLWALGVIGDLLAAQRVMTQKTFERVRRIELELGVAPSHYEPRHERRAASAPATPPRARSRATPSARRRCACERRDRLRRRRSSPATPTTSTARRNPVVRRLMAGFERTLDELLAQRRAALAARRRLRRGRARAPLGAAPAASARVVGIDLEEESIQAGWAERQAPNLEYRAMPAENLPFADGRVRPGERDRGARARARPRAHARRDGALRRAPPARVGAARAAVADAEHGARRLLGAARQHAGPPQPLVQALVRAAARRATARSSRCARRSPGRCCLSASSGPARSAPRGRAASQRSYGSGARILSIGIASTGPADVRLLLDRQPRARRAVGQAHRPAVVGHVRDHLGDLPADRTAALAHDRRTPRARPRASTRCACRC